MLIVAYVVGKTLHDGVTDDVDPSLQFAVAVYAAVLLLFTDGGPLIVRPVRMAVTLIIVTVLLAVFVTPPAIYTAVTVNGWLPVTAEVTNKPLLLIVAYTESSLHDGLIVLVVPSLQVAIAVYVPVLLSAIDKGPFIINPIRVGAVVAGPSTQNS